MCCESFCRLPFITKFTSAVVLDEEDMAGGPILPELSEIKLLAACLAADPSLIQQHINFHAWICHLSAKMIPDKNATDNGWKMNASHERFLAGEVLVLPQLWACWCPSGCPILLSLSFSLAKAAYCTGWSSPPFPGNRRSAGVRVPCWSWQCSEHQNISAQGAPSSLDAFLSYCNAVCTLSFPSPEISLPHYLHFLWGWAHLIKEISCDLLC